MRGGRDLSGKRGGGGPGRAGAHRQVGNEGLLETVSRSSAPLAAPPLPRDGAGERAPERALGPNGTARHGVHAANKTTDIQHRLTPRQRYATPAPTATPRTPHRSMAAASSRRDAKRRQATPRRGCWLLTDPALRVRVGFYDLADSGWPGLGRAASNPQPSTLYPFTICMTGDRPSNP